MAFLQHKKLNRSNYLMGTLIPVGYLNVSSQAGNYIFLGLHLLFRRTAFLPLTVVISYLSTHCQVQRQ